MNYLYSASGNLFYVEEWESDYGKNWPLDCVDVTETQFHEFTDEPPAGKMRVSGDDGLPCWGDIPPPTHEEKVAVSEVEKQSRIDQANAYMNGRQWPGKAAMGRLTDVERSQYNDWLDYLDALEEVNISTAPNVIWPEKPE